MDFIRTSPGEGRWCYTGLVSALLAKDAAARRLIQWHFTVEPELREVYRIVLDDEGSQEEPIRLLEVNAATVPTGSVEPFTFSPTKEIPFRTVIAEITPEELASFESNPEALPKGWSLSRAEHFVRSRFRIPPGDDAS
jgi:hypothetical protein